ncbi:hypothetical protein THRCLA_20288 [Thraustotheca clavata]|uniref:Protein kinase domain-containing protein n=1 Tax=Thraustotheca clavata TaxID=74557 RepID=A0A1W0A986_9STRA|nr:hypothetical protein THRCLA_20288 [Thraustotheca clavata]
MLLLEPVDRTVSSEKPISFGAFGEVWLGEYIRERVAIKRIKDKPTDLECVVEYMDRGDLRSILEKMSKAEYTWEEKLTSIVSIVRGCIYLHTFEPQIIHLDLKSRIVLTQRKEQKITDFGEAREMDD